MKMHRKQIGMLSIELVVALGLLVAIFGVLAALNTSFGKLNTYLWAEHTCYDAAQAQADAIAVTGRPIDEAVFQQLWPGVVYSIDTTAGLGQWEGLLRINVTTRKNIGYKDVEVILTRYLNPPEGVAR